jgi:hypothetical protein
MNSIDLVDLLSINSVPILAGRESCAHKSLDRDQMIGNKVFALQCILRIVEKANS